MSIAQMFARGSRFEDRWIDVSVLAISRQMSNNDIYMMMILYELTIGETLMHRMEETQLLAESSGCSTRTLDVGVLVSETSETPEVLRIGFYFPSCYPRAS